jgi:hypothetical protein
MASLRTVVGALLALLSVPVAAAGYWRCVCAAGGLCVCLCVCAEQGGGGRYGRKLLLLQRARPVTTVAEARAALATARVKRLGVYAKAAGTVLCAAPLAANATGLQVAICHVTYYAATGPRRWFTRGLPVTRTAQVPFQVGLPDGPLTVRPLSPIHTHTHTHTHKCLYWR